MHISCLKRRVDYNYVRYLVGVYIMTECKCCENHYKNKERDDAFKANLQSRLNRISGQLNGIKTMIDENRYCGDVLIQISAVESALKEIGYIILNDHLKTCVKDDVLNNDDKSLEEVIELVRKLK